MTIYGTIKPIHVTDTCWLYGERDGLAVVQEYRDGNGELIKTLTVTIPWAKIARAKSRRPMDRTKSQSEHQEG